MSALGPGVGQGIEVYVARCDEGWRRETMSGQAMTFAWMTLPRGERVEAAILGEVAERCELPWLQLGEWYAISGVYDIGTRIRLIVYAIRHLPEYESWEPGIPGEHPLRALRTPLQDAGDRLAAKAKVAWLKAKAEYDRAGPQDGPYRPAHADECWAEFEALAEAIAEWDELRGT